jgi:Recombination endonuclease VII
MPSLKACTKCHQELEINKENFRTYPTGRIHSWCRKCENTYTREYLKTAKGKKATKTWRQNNPDKVNAWYRADRQNHPERHASYDLKKRVGITLAQKTEQFEKQGRKCAICQSPAPNTKNQWFADHCHKTKKFRGVLCGHCNSILGYANDNPAILMQAVVYLAEAA